MQATAHAIAYGEQPPTAAPPPAYGNAGDQPPSAYGNPAQPTAPMLYPSLGDYMGLSLPQEVVDQHMAVVTRHNQEVNSFLYGFIPFISITATSLHLKKCFF